MQRATLPEESPNHGMTQLDFAEHLLDHKAWAESLAATRVALPLLKKASELQAADPGRVARGYLALAAALRPLGHAQELAGLRGELAAWHAEHARTTPAHAHNGAIARALLRLDELAAETAPPAA